MAVESSEHENEAVLTAEEQSALRKEIAADPEAGKREDAHWYGTEAFQKILNEKSKAPAPEKGKDRGIER
jgi:hypothetical protein